MASSDGTAGGKPSGALTPNEGRRSFKGGAAALLGSASMGTNSGFSPSAGRTLNISPSSPALVQGMATAAAADTMVSSGRSVLQMSGGEFE